MPATPAPAITTRSGWVVMRMDARSASRRCHPDRARHRLRETTEAHGHRPGLSERQPAPPRRSTHRVARARREGWRGRGTRHRRASRAVTARAAVLRGRDVAERALVDLRAGERVVLDVAARHGSGGDLRPADGARGDVRAADAIVGDGARAHGPGAILIAVTTAVSRAAGPTLLSLGAAVATVSMLRLSASRLIVRPATAMITFPLLSTATAARRRPTPPRSRTCWSASARSWRPTPRSPSSSATPSW